MGQCGRAGQDPGAGRDCLLGGRLWVVQAGDQRGEEVSPVRRPEVKCWYTRNGFGQREALRGGESGGCSRVSFLSGRWAEGTLF
jgi:hypothetical protein